MLTAPLEKFSLRLQHLDATGGGSMIELCNPASSGLLDRLFGTFWELLNDWNESDHQHLLPFVTWYLHDAGVPHDELLDKQYETCVGLAAAIWARFAVIYHEHPFRFSVLH